MGDGVSTGVLQNPYYFGVNSLTDPLTKEFNKADRASGDRSYHRMVEVARSLEGSAKTICRPDEYRSAFDLVHLRSGDEMIEGVEPDRPSRIGMSRHDGKVAPWAMLEVSTTK